jgi:CheY-like chemotaxis protein
VNDASSFRTNLVKPPGAIARCRLQGATRAVILLADDDRSGRQALAAGLRQHDYIVHEAASGVETMDAAELKQPDLILLDTRMPDTDGVEAVTELKANPATARIPVITLGSVSLRGDQEKCLAVGAVACLTRPLGAREVAAVIEQHLPKRPNDPASY